MPTDNARPPLWVRLGARKLESNRGLDVIGGARIAGDSADQLAVRIGDGSALLFDAAAVANPWHLVLAPTVLTLTIVLVFVTLLSIYAVRWITEPLSSVAAAAQSFGRRSEEHTSELQSLMRISYAVFCLKKKHITYTTD